MYFRGFPVLFPLSFFSYFILKKSIHIVILCGTHLAQPWICGINLPHSGDLNIANDQRQTNETENNAAQDRVAFSALSSAGSACGKRGLLMNRALPYVEASPGARQ